MMKVVAVVCLAVVALQGCELIDDLTDVLDNTTDTATDILNTMTESEIDEEAQDAIENYLKSETGEMRGELSDLVEDDSGDLTSVSIDKSGTLLGADWKLQLHLKDCTGLRSLNLRDAVDIKIVKRYQDGKRLFSFTLEIEERTIQCSGSGRIQVTIPTQFRAFVQDIDHSFDFDGEVTIPAIKVHVEVALVYNADRKHCMKDIDVDVTVGDESFTDAIAVFVDKLFDRVSGRPALASVLGVVPDLKDFIRPVLRQLDLLSFFKDMRGRVAGKIRPMLQHFAKKCF